MLAIVVGKLGAEQREAVQTAATRAGVTQVICASNAQEAATVVASLSETPRCFLAAQLQDVDDIAGMVNGNAALHGVPTLFLSTHPNASVYREAYGRGAEDMVVATDVGGLVRRLANLREYDPSIRPVANRGRALIASEDVTNRSVVGRALRKAGFEISFAGGETDLAVPAAESELPDFVVATSALLPAVEAAGIARGQEGVPTMVLGEHAARPTGRPDIGQLLFWVDQNVGARGRNQRRSPRIMCSVMCTFRGPESFEPTYAVTHDISGEGLYIRTLDPPRPQTEIWIELREAGGRLMQVRGEVVWCRSPSQAGGSAPIGFGVSLLLETTPGRDYARYVQFYNEVLHDEVGPQDVN